LLRIIYDPHLITVGRLLQIFFSVATDPTQLNQQFPDEGTQYRSEQGFRCKKRLSFALYVGRDGSNFKCVLLFKIVGQIGRVASAEEVSPDATGLKCSVRRSDRWASYPMSSSAPMVAFFHDWAKGPWLLGERPR
jgi:hypothetical protein